jgi:hypothetical protein
MDAIAFNYSEGHYKEAVEVFQSASSVLDQVLISDLKMKFERLKLGTKYFILYFNYLYFYIIYYYIYFNSNNSNIVLILKFIFYFYFRVKVTYPDGTVHYFGPKDD